MPDINSTLWTEERFSTLGDQVSAIVEKTIESYPIVYTATKEEIDKGLGKSNVLEKRNPSI